MSAIELRGVQKRYGRVEVLRGIDLAIEADEFCVLLGPSGCGKSTLLRLIAGLEDPSAGDILIAATRVNDMPPAERDIGMVFQSYALYPHLSVYDNMAFGLRHRKLSASEIDWRVREAADALQLSEPLRRKPAALSGGQRQRVAIGRAMVRRPRIFLFDEPLSNLDAALRVKTRVEIARLHRRLRGTSMVYVTHDQTEAMTLATRIVLLQPPTGPQASSIAQVGSPLELYHQPASVFVAGFIGSPAMNLFAGTAGPPTPAGLVLSLGGRRALAAVRPRQGMDHNAPVTVGIRPENLLVGAGPFQGSVTHVEQLGERAHLYLRTALMDGPLVATLASTAARVGDTLAFDLPSEAVHVFDARGDALERLARH